MRRREIIIFIILACMLFIGYCLHLKKIDEKTCQSFVSTKSTAANIQLTLETLDTFLNEGVDKITKLYDEETMNQILKEINQNTYYVDTNGIFQNVFDQHGSTGFATGYIPIDEDIKNMLMATESLENYYKECLNDCPFVSLIYYNEKRSFSRVYPAFQIEGLVTYGCNITDYVFYNAIFEKGNKSRFISEPYIDPAGNGWVISMLQPIFIEDQLKGVLGADIELEYLKEMLLASSGMLIVNNEGDIIALSEDMYQQIGLRPLEKHRYYQDVNSTMSLPEVYNMNKSKIMGFREMWQQISKDEISCGEIDFDGKIREYCSFEIEDFSIYLLHINVQ